MFVCFGKLRETLVASVVSPLPCGCEFASGYLLFVRVWTLLGEGYVEGAILRMVHVFALPLLLLFSRVGGSSIAEVAPDHTLEWFCHVSNYLLD